MVRKSTELELSDIQRIVFRGYRYKYVGICFLTIANAVALKESLKKFIDNLPPLSVADDTENGRTCWNIAFTYQGVSKLNPQFRFKNWDRAFQAGAEIRGAKLNDIGQNAPANWEYGNSNTSVDCIMLVNADSSALVDAQMASILRDLTGVKENHREVGYKPDDKKEHFGFMDGISQPAIEGLPFTQQPGGGVWEPDKGAWRPLKPGLFALGYESEEAAAENGDDPAFLNGSYAVIRKLEQDVAGFRRFIDEQSGKLSMPPDLVAAKMIGRWADGTPIALSPNGPDERTSSTDSRINNFSYDNDSAGLKCPVGAHIRRSNPRGDPAVPAGRSTLHVRRIMRRGLLYGDKLAEGQPDDKAPRGLLFIALCASLEHQFEFIQQSWINDNEFDREDGSVDPICGNADDAAVSNKLRVPGSGTIFSIPSFVTVKGSVYLFFPGIKSLQFLVTM